MPAPLGKLLTTLLSMVALVSVDDVDEEPRDWMWMPEPFDVAVELVLVTVLPVMMRSAIVPEMLLFVPAEVLKAMFDVSAAAALPELETVLLVKVKLVTVVPFTPLPAV